MGAKRPLKGVRNTDTKTILLSKTKFAKKQFFFCAMILHPLLEKVFKSDTTSFHYFSPSIPILDIQLREVGAKKRLNGTSKVNRHAHTKTDTHTQRQTHTDTQTHTHTYGQIDL